MVIDLYPLRFPSKRSFVFKQQLLFYGCYYKIHTNVGTTSTAPDSNILL